MRVLLMPVHCSAALRASFDCQCFTGMGGCKSKEANTQRLSRAAASRVNLKPGEFRSFLKRPGCLSEAFRSRTTGTLRNKILLLSRLV